MRLYGSPRLLKRKVTEEWLQQIVDKEDLRFKHFITLSFNRGQTDEIGQYLDNKHIKKVILDFFYPNGKKPENRIRMWFFVERHLSGKLHLHILIEGMDEFSWLRFNNRKVTLRKSTLYSILSDEVRIEEVMMETLTNHLQSYILKLGKGKQSIDIRKIGDIDKKVHYVNKSLSSLSFDKWEHIDFENSDLEEKEWNLLQHQHQRKFKIVSIITMTN